jgi:hypothetical protein
MKSAAFSSPASHAHRTIETREATRRSDRSAWMPRLRAAAKLRETAAIGADATPLVSASGTS